MHADFWKEMLLKAADSPGIRCEDNTEMRPLEIVFEMDEAGTESRRIRSIAVC
jgi:hypothetical protein